jgi:hypothetical protein
VIVGLRRGDGVGGRPDLVVDAGRRGGGARQLLHGHTLLQLLERHRLLVDLAQHEGRRATGGVVRQAVLVHDPVGLGASRRAALVVDERLLEPDEPLRVGGAAHGAVRPRGLPEPSLRRTARPAAAAGLLIRPVARHEEVPLPLADARQARELPRIMAVEVDGRDDVELELLALYNLLQLELQELLLRRVEPETRQLQLRRAAAFHHSSF